MKTKLFLVILFSLSFFNVSCTQQMQAELSHAVLSGIAQGMQRHQMMPPRGYQPQYRVGGGQMMMPPPQYGGGYPMGSPVYGSSGGLRPYNFHTSYEGGARRAMDQINAAYYQRQQMRRR